ncbi:hypothetical protein ANN_15892 [Periplaneta americana]|uniref:Uncharacterized protein n=1 Tax=Periplaneta americana TaxID=6978 RepID=A0ABQ8SIU4_PERAM|nr:hypothetical protein ANN_15892 [Periplaneta americana]
MLFSIKTRHERELTLKFGLKPSIRNKPLLSVWSTTWEEAVSRILSSCNIYRSRPGLNQQLSDPVTGYLASEWNEDDNAGKMSPGSNTDSYPAFAHIILRENLGKNLNQVVYNNTTVTQLRRSFAITSLRKKWNIDTEMKCMKYVFRRIANGTWYNRTSWLPRAGRPTRHGDGFPGPDALLGALYPAQCNIGSELRHPIGSIAWRRQEIEISATEVKVGRPREQTEHVEMGVCDNHVGTKNGEEDSGKTEGPMELLLQEGSWYPVDKNGDMQDNMADARKKMDRP